MLRLILNAKESILLFGVKTPYCEVKHMLLCPQVYQVMCYVYRFTKFCVMDMSLPSVTSLYQV